MNCARHPEMPAAAYCRTCGKALCESCKREIRGVIYCEDCLATRVQTAVSPSVAVVTPSGGPHPAVAGVLAGFFPFGVGQAYNGQYARGFVYLVTFIGLIWAVSHSGSAAPVFGISIAVYIIFQIVDAVRSAHYLQRGLPAPDPFGLDRMFGGSGVPAPQVPATPAAGPLADAGSPPAVVVRQEGCCEPRSHVPLGAVLLIGIGVLLLLGNIGWLRWHWAGDFWPLILIIIGGWLLATRWDDIAAGTPRGRRMLMGPAILLVFGATVLLQNLEIVDFHRSWPLILIVIGVVLLWQRSGPLPPVRPAGVPPEQPLPDTSVEQSQER
jgi:TM2 domain-containing membrane protein YozV